MNIKYISINILPNGKIPPSITIDIGFMIHLASGIGLGIGLILHGTLMLPLVFLPKRAPMRFNGRMTKPQMAPMASIVVKDGGQCVGRW